MKIIIVILTFAYVHANANDIEVKYQNGQLCNCDSIHNEYYYSVSTSSFDEGCHGFLCDSINNKSSMGTLWKEIPYKNGRIDGEIYEYDRNGVIIKDVDDLESKSIDSSEIIISSKQTKMNSIPPKFLFIIGAGYFTAVHYLGVEFGLGYLGGLDMEKKYGLGLLATVVYANSCEEDDYDKANVDVSEFNKKGDKGYSFCRTGKGIGIRLGILKNIYESSIMAYSGGIIYNNKILIQNDDSILGKYTGTSGKDSKTEIVIPFGLLYQSNSPFGLAIEGKTDLSIGIVANVAIDMK